MKNIECVIIDDEPGNIITLSELLSEYCPYIKVISTAANPIEGYEVIKHHEPQLLFLDIEMPHGNGFDLLDKLSPITFEVIFITAFNEYAIKAFKYAAVDYILKPINITELKEAVNRVSDRRQEKVLNTKLNALLNNLGNTAVNKQKIGLATADGLIFEDAANIMYLRASGSYTEVFIAGKPKILVSRSLKDFDNILTASFCCRVHHSTIINVNFVKRYYKGRGGYVEMQDGTTIEISTRKKDIFFEKFMH